MERDIAYSWSVFMIVLLVVLIMTMTIQFTNFGKNTYLMIREVLGNTLLKNTDSI